MVSALVGLTIQWVLIIYLKIVTISTLCAPDWHFSRSSCVLTNHLSSFSTFSSLHCDPTSSHYFQELRVLKHSIKSFKDIVYLMPRQPNTRWKLHLITLLVQCQTYECLETSESLLVIFSPNSNSHKSILRGKFRVTKADNRGVQELQG